MMKTKMLLLSVTAALALSATAAPAAWALETEWVATGTVYDSYDTGVFGPAGASLDGDNFTANFYIKTSDGYFNSTQGVYQSVVGGTEQGTPNPVFASLTINGIVAYFGSNADYADAITGLYAPDDDIVYAETDTYNDSGQFAGYLQADIANNYVNSSYPTVFGQPFSISTNDGSGNSDGGEFILENPSTGDESAFGELDVTNISSPGVISAAPEPSAWALLIAGVGVCGFTLRSGRRRGWAMA